VQFRETAEHNYFNPWIPTWGISWNSLPSDRKATPITQGAVQCMITFYNFPR